MQGSIDPSSKFETLRQQAEALIRKQPELSSEAPSDILELIHELKIHQAELEIQNEELQRAQQEISELKKEYENLYEFAPCGYLTLNEKGIITRANLTAVSLLGTTREALRHSNFSRFVHPDYEEMFINARRQASKTGEKQSVDLLLKSEKVSTEWVQAVISADRDADNAVMQWRITLTDITARKKADEALKVSEKKYRTLFEAESDAIFMVDAETGAILEANQAAEDLYGYSKAEFARMTAMDLSAEPDETRKVIEKSSGKSKLSLRFHKKKDWTVFPVEISANSFDLNGRKINISAVRDMSEEKRLEEELKEHELEIITLLHNIPGMAYKADHTWAAKVTSGSNRVVGYNIEELNALEQNWADIVHPEDKEGVFSEGHQLTKAPGYLVQTYRVISKTGEVRWVEDRKISIFTENDAFKEIHGIVFDITDRKEAERAQLENSRRLGRIVEYMPVLLNAIDEENNFIFWNVECERVTGYDSAEIVQNPRALEILYPDIEYRNQMLAEFEEAGGDFRGKEYTLTCKDGTKRTISWSNISAKCPVPGWHAWAVGADVSARKQAAALKNGEIFRRQQIESALRESKEQYQALFESIRDAILVADTERHITACNSAFIDLFEYDPEEIKGKLTLSLYESEEEFAKLGQALKAEPSGESFPMTVQYQKKSGDTFPGETAVYSLKDHDGNLTGFIGLIRDVSKRMEQEKALAQALDEMEVLNEHLENSRKEEHEFRKRLDAILMSVVDGLVVFDNHCQVLLMNPAAEELFDVQFSEVQGKVLGLSIQNATLKNCITKALEEREAGYEFDFEFQGDDSEPPRILHAKTAKVKSESEKKGNQVMVVSDVTAVREINQMKTEFLSTAAHELRTPLTTIQGFSEILMTRDKLGAERREKYLADINQQAALLGQLINELLDISRIEAGKGTSLYKQDFDLGALLRERVEQFDLQNQEHTFEIRLPPDPVTPSADKDKLRQALDNLLSNAVKYSPEGGRIQISAENLPQKQAVRIRVADQGKGMSQQQVDQIFDKFYRADASNTAIEGTGLGMSIVKYIVEAHGGTVTVDSAPGRGTTVSIDIPQKG